MVEHLSDETGGVTVTHRCGNHMAGCVGVERRTCGSKVTLVIPGPVTYHPFHSCVG
jgi:hypothetical protein